MEGREKGWFLGSNRWRWSRPRTAGSKGTGRSTALGRDKGIRNGSKCRRRKQVLQRHAVEEIKWGISPKPVFQFNGTREEKEGKKGTPDLTERTGREWRREKELTCWSCRNGSCHTRNGFRSNHNDPSVGQRPVTHPLTRLWTGAHCMFPECHVARPFGICTEFCWKGDPCSDRPTPTGYQRKLVMSFSGNGNGYAGHHMADLEHGSTWESIQRGRTPHTVVTSLTTSRGSVSAIYAEQLSRVSSGSLGHSHKH